MGCAMEKMKMREWIVAVAGLFTIALGTVYLVANPLKWPRWSIYMAWAIITGGVLLLICGSPWRWPARYRILLIAGLLAAVGGPCLYDVLYLYPESRKAFDDPLKENKTITENQQHETPDPGTSSRTSREKRENAEPSFITMEAYYKLLEDKGIPQLDVAKQYIGKRVTWTGHFHSLDLAADSVAERYRILLVCDPEHITDYLYFYVSAADELQVAQIAKMRKGVKVTVSGILCGRTNLSDVKIENVQPEP